LGGPQQLLAIGAGGAGVGSIKEAGKEGVESRIPKVTGSTRNKNNYTAQL